MINVCRFRQSKYYYMWAKRYKQSPQKTLQGNAMCTLDLVQMAFSSYWFTKIKENRTSLSVIFFFLCWENFYHKIERALFCLLFLIVFQGFNIDWKMPLTSIHT